MSSIVTPNDLTRVLERAKSSDALGEKIARAIDLIDGVLGDAG